MSQMNNQSLGDITESTIWNIGTFKHTPYRNAIWIASLTVVGRLHKSDRVNKALYLFLTKYVSEPAKLIIINDETRTPVSKRSYFAVHYLNLL